MREEEGRRRGLERIVKNRLIELACKVCLFCFVHSHCVRAVSNLLSTCRGIVVVQTSEGAVSVVALRVTSEGVVPSSITAVCVDVSTVVSSREMQIGNALHPERNKGYGSR